MTTLADRPPKLPPLHLSHARRCLDDSAYRHYLLESILTRQPPVLADRNSSSATKESSMMANMTIAQRNISESSTEFDPADGTNLIVDDKDVSSTIATFSKTEKVDSHTASSGPRAGSVYARRDPFAHDGGEGGVKYKTMTWWYVSSHLLVFFSFLVETPTYHSFHSQPHLANRPSPPQASRHGNDSRNHLPRHPLPPIRPLYPRPHPRPHPHPRPRPPVNLHRLRDRPVQAPLPTGPLYGRRGRDPLRPRGP